MRRKTEDSRNMSQISLGECTFLFLAKKSFKCFQNPVLRVQIRVFGFQGQECKFLWIKREVQD